MYLSFLYIIFPLVLTLLNPALSSVFIHPEKAISTPDTLEIPNPVVPGDFADPSIIRVGAMYYSVGTSSEWAPHFPVFKSKDLNNWQQTGYVFKKAPSWTKSSFWAPEFFYHNGTYFVYYVAKRKSDGMSCIGVATSKSPEGEFVDHGVLFTHGKEAIDPFIFNDNGQLYLTFKAYGLDSRPIELMAFKLSEDGLKVIGEPVSLLKDEKRQLMEGQSLLKRDGYYYLFYSAGACCGFKCDYNVRVARSKSFLGPYEKQEAAILEGGGEWVCPGHGTVVETPDKRYYYMYHAYNKKNNIYTGREGMLDELLWNEQTKWPYFKSKNPTVSKSKREVEGKYKVADDFKSQKLSDFWQWDFRNTEPQIALKNGNVYLAGKAAKNNYSGTAMTLRPFTGSYQFTTEVVNSNNTVKGLVLYGDASQAVGIGVQNDKVLLWEVKDSKRTVCNTDGIGTAKAVKLKMEVNDGNQCRFFYSLKDGEWKELKIGDDAFYDGKHLPQWDRSPRPGLIHFGGLNQPAAFSYFKVDFND